MTISSVSRLWIWWLWLLLGGGVGVTFAQDCAQSEVTKIAVASVFGTLAVVLLVLGIAIFVLWRRRRGLLYGPKRTRKANGYSEDLGNVTSQHGQGHVNLAYDDFDQDDAEAGTAKHSPKKGQSPPKIPNNNGKTWTSFPHSDFPDVLNRQGSCGSLDNHYLQTGSEPVSVWLQSQDIIGLGFNISGNMRDGIFVSQVHNRGPAIESGKIQVGDRIMSVTIAYENIVYEDALTILSYASPYPVKVTLHKERAAIADPRLGSSEQLNHPLYRSQSMDALQRIQREHALKPKRTQSEMKSETRKESGKSKSKGDRKSKALSQSYSEYSGGVLPEVTSDVMVHALKEVQRLPAERSSHVQPSLVHSEKTPHIAQGATVRTESPLETKGKQRKNVTETDHELADFVDHLEDKPVEKDHARLAANVSLSPKIPPSKPERKKKSSDSSLISVEMPANEVGEVEDMFHAVTAQTSLAGHLGGSRQEVEEEPIIPVNAKRNVVIGSNNIEFTVTTTTSVGNQETYNTPPGSPDNRMNFVMPELKCPSAVAREEVQEDFIEASVVKKAAKSPPLARSAGHRDTSLEKGTSKPPLDDMALERLIAMNSFPPGTQGWAGITAGGMQGGVPDDFLPPQLQPFLNSELSQRPASHAKVTRQGNKSLMMQSSVKGGLAFEVRDDVITGKPINVEIRKSISSIDNSLLGGVHQKTPADQSSSGDRMVRANSLRDGTKYHQHSLHNEFSDSRSEGFGWSGTRLVRAGSFSEIPQNDSVSDWTDKNFLFDDDDSMSGKLSVVDSNIESDLENEPLRLLRGADKNLFRARENLANVSDLSSSRSSSRCSSPSLTNGSDLASSGLTNGSDHVSAGLKNGSDNSSPVLTNGTDITLPVLTNGPDTDIFTMPDSEPLKDTVPQLSPSSKRDIITKSASVSVSASTTDDMDC